MTLNFISIISAKDLEAGKDAKKEETPVVPTTVPTTVSTAVPKTKSKESVREEPKKDDKIVENLENKHNQQKPENFKKEMESNKKETPIPILNDSKIKSLANDSSPEPKIENPDESEPEPKTNKHGKRSLSTEARKALAYFQETSKAPNEGKPNNPFEGFP